MSIIANLRAQRNLLRQIREELFENIATLLEAYPFEDAQAEVAANREKGGESDLYLRIEVLYGQLELLGKDIMEIHSAINELLKDGMRKAGEERVEKSD